MLKSKETVITTLKDLFNTGFVHSFMGNLAFL